MSLLVYIHVCTNRQMIGEAHTRQATCICICITSVHMHTHTDHNINDYDHTPLLYR